MSGAAFFIFPASTLLKELKKRIPVTHVVLILAHIPVFMHKEEKKPFIPYSNNDR